MKRFTLRLPIELHDRLSKEALEDGRSLHSYVVRKLEGEMPFRTIEVNPEITKAKTLLTKKTKDVYEGNIKVTTKNLHAPNCPCFSCKPPKK